MDRIDHFVLTVRSIERTCAFYERVLGMETVHYGHGRTALRLGEQRINLHEVGKEFAPRATHPTPGAGDFCLITRRQLGDWIDHVQACGVELIEGPVKRTGALGPMESIYFRDPDGNLVEVANYGKSEP